MLLNMWPKHSVKLLSRFSHNTPKLSCARKPILSLSQSLSLLHCLSAFPPFVAPRLSCTSYCISFLGRAVILATVLTLLSSKVSSYGVDSICGFGWKEFQEHLLGAGALWGVSVQLTLRLRPSHAQGPAPIKLDVTSGFRVTKQTYHCCSFIFPPLLQNLEEDELGLFSSRTLQCGRRDVSLVFPKFP